MEVKPWRDRSGTLSLPLAMILAVTAAVGLGLLGTATLWLNRVQTQLELDRCVGAHAIALRDTLRFLESRNREIRILRAAGAGALALGQVEIVAASRKASKVAAGLQDLALLRWDVKRTQWWLSRNCRSSGKRQPLPELKLERGADDALGSRELDLGPLAHAPLRIHLSRFGRHSNSFIHLVEERHGSQWLASWKSP